MRKITLIFFILFVAVSVNAQTYKQFCLSAFCGIAAGMTEGSQILDRNPHVDLSPTWHKTKLISQGGLLALGALIYHDADGDWKKIVKSVLFNATVFWIAHDITYNLMVYPDESIFYSSPNTSSGLDRVQFCKPVILILC